MAFARSDSNNGQIWRIYLFIYFQQLHRQIMNISNYFWAKSIFGVHASPRHCPFIRCSHRFISVINNNKCISCVRGAVLTVPAHWQCTRGIVSVQRNLSNAFPFTSVFLPVSTHGDGDRNFNHNLFHIQHERDTKYIASIYKLRCKSIECV